METKNSFFLYAKLILAFLGALLLVIFAIQNAQEVEVRLWLWGFTASLSLILFISIIIGVLISIVFTSVVLRRKKPKAESKPHEQKEKIEENKNIEEI
jgi:uncharacterized integral membrane protein